jgi:outer membrane protein TolC
MLFALVAAASAEPYTLEAALAAARSHAPEATILDARRDQARADAAAARAALLPQVSGSAMYRHNDKEIAFPNPFDPTGESVLSIQKLDVESVTASASQVLFNAGLFGRVIAAGHANEAAEATEDAGELDLALRVATLWLAARSAAELRLATLESLRAAEAHAKIAEAGLAAGAVTPLAVDRAQLALLDAQQKLVDATRTKADLLGQLGLLVGEDAPEIAPVPLAEAADVPVEADVIGKALGARPELSVARAQLAAARAGTWVVAGDWAPAITAIGAATYTNSPLFTDDLGSWYVGLSATLPILDGGLRFAEARRTNAQIEAASANLDRVEASTREEVRAALRGEDAASQALALARKQEEIAGRALKVAEDAFAVGGATAVDAEDAQTAVYSASVGRIRAEAAWLGARWQRLRLCGEPIGGWDGGGTGDGRGMGHGLPPVLPRVHPGTSRPSRTGDDTVRREADRLAGERRTVRHGQPDGHRQRRSAGRNSGVLRLVRARVVGVRAAGRHRDRRFVGHSGGACGRGGGVHPAVRRG